MLARISRAPVVSIASIRGRATGVGRPAALASDMRFASREKAVLSQWEVGAGLVPGRPMARLPRLMGRGRALEVLLGADDINGDLAELYGYVNRSLPDARNWRTLLIDWPRESLHSTSRRSRIQSIWRIVPACRWTQRSHQNGMPLSTRASVLLAKERLRKLMELGFHRPGDVEDKLGHYVGQLGI